MGIEELEKDVMDHETRIRCMEKSVTVLQENFKGINDSLKSIVKDTGQFKWWVMTSVLGAILLTMLAKFLGL